MSKNQISMKKRSKFSHLLTVRAEVADPPPPLKVSLTVKYPGFVRTPLSVHLTNIFNIADQLTPLFAI